MLQESHEALSEQATSLSKQVEELKDQIASLQSSAVAAEQQVSSLQEQLANETAANKAHQETVERQTEELQVYCQPLRSPALQSNVVTSTLKSLNLDTQPRHPRVDTFLMFRCHTCVKVFTFHYLPSGVQSCIHVPLHCIMQIGFMPFPCLMSCIIPFYQQRPMNSTPQCVASATVCVTLQYSNLLPSCCYSILNSLNCSAVRVTHIWL